MSRSHDGKFSISRITKNSATNSTVDINDLFLILRFTAKDFCISRRREYTSITIHGTDFYQIKIHRTQKNRLTASRKYPCPRLCRSLHIFTFSSPNKRTLNVLYFDIYNLPVKHVSTGVQILYNRFACYLNSGELECKWI